MKFNKIEKGLYKAENGLYITRVTKISSAGRESTPKGCKASARKTTVWSISELKENGCLKKWYGNFNTLAEAKAYIETL